MQGPIASRIAWHTHGTHTAHMWDACSTPTSPPGSVSRHSCRGCVGSRWRCWCTARRSPSRSGSGSGSGSGVGSGSGLGSGLGLGLGLGLQGAPELPSLVLLPAPAAASRASAWTALYDAGDGDEDSSSVRTWSIYIYDICIYI